MHVPIEVFMYSPVQSRTELLETRVNIPEKIGLFKKIFYLFIHERHTERQRHRQREKQAPSREPDAGLDPRTPGAKADAQPQSHPRAPDKIDLIKHYTG